MSAPTPVVLALPVLPLRRPVEFGPWWLGSLEDFQGPWLSSEFESSARRFLGAFRDSSDDAIEKPAIIARREGGADGQPPTIAEHRAISAAIAFAVINQNPYWSEEVANAAWQVATTDNADLWVQPLHPDGAIALGTGYRVAVTSGGWKVSDEGFRIPTPLELHMPLGVTLDEELLNATYTVLTTPPPGTEKDARRIQVAIRWLLKSWQNTPSITWEDRLVFLKVATEAVTRNSNNAESAKSLEALFASAKEQDGGAVGIDDLLWQPDQPTYERTFHDRTGARTEEVSAFVDWAIELGRSRNALVHGDDDATLHYEKPDSPFNGPFVEVADRVVREAIGLLLGQCGFPSVWRRGLSRASYEALKHLESMNGSNEDHPCEGDAES
jgi:hypothetical protein